MIVGDSVVCCVSISFHQTGVSSHLYTLNAASVLALGIGRNPSEDGVSEPARRGARILDCTGRRRIQLRVWRIEGFSSGFRGSKDLRGLRINVWAGSSWIRTERIRHGRDRRHGALILERIEGFSPILYTLDCGVFADRKVYYHK